MEDAGENRIEAERFLDKALKMFPEDGYFLKYKADILWMDHRISGRPAGNICWLCS